MKRKKKPRKSARRSAARRPDEVFSAGPLQMARFGRHVVWQANWPPGEFDKFQARLVAGYDEVAREIDRDIGDTATLVSQRCPEVIARPTGLTLSGHRRPMPTGAR
jgi:hypothetical protein